MIAAGSLLNRADGYQYRLDHEVTLGADGTGTGSITAVLPSVLDDTTGGGIAGNADAGTSLTLDVAIGGFLGNIVNSVTSGEGIVLRKEYRRRWRRPP